MGSVTVTSCEQQGKGKYKVCFDNGVECFLYRGEIRDYHILPQADISEENYRLLLSETLSKRARKRAMHLLEQMDRSEMKLREKLNANGYPQECIDDAIDYVKSFHYLDDFRLACNLVRYQCERLSRQQLIQKLLSKGISMEVAQQALETEYTAEESEQIQALLRKRKYEPENCDEGEFRRTYSYLARRGFRSSDILKAMKKNEII